MNKLLQTTLVLAIFFTSGFAASGAGMADFQNGGLVQNGATIDFQGQTLTLAEGKSLDVYGSLTGTGTIKTSGEGKVNVYGSIYKPDDSNKEAILTATGLSGFSVHTLDESNKGFIAETVTVDPAESLNKSNTDLATYASSQSDGHLIYIANSSGTDTKCIGGKTSAIEVSAALGNADASIEGLIPTPLVIENKLKFTGNNSGFSEKTVTIGTTDTAAEVVYATVDSAFQTDTTVEKGSKLTISPVEGLTLSKNLTINGTSKFGLNKEQDEVIHDIQGGSLVVTGKLTLKSGCTLTLGNEYDHSPIAENPSQYPKVMIWPAGSFANELTERYYFQNESGLLSTTFWKEGNEWKTNYSNVTITESDGQLTFSRAWNDDMITYDIPVSDVTKSYTWDNPKVYEESTDEMMHDNKTQVFFDAAVDNIFSYTYDENNNSWVRRNQYMVFQPNSIDPDAITEDKSTWRIFELTEPYNTTVSSGKEVTHFVLSSNTSCGEYAIEEGKIKRIGWGTSWETEGDSHTGHWIVGNNNVFFKIYKQLDEWARTHTFEETWYTLEEYNAKNKTEYTWQD